MLLSRSRYCTGLKPNRGTVVWRVLRVVDLDSGKSGIRGSNFSICSTVVPRVADVVVIARFHQRRFKTTRVPVHCEVELPFPK